VRLDDDELPEYVYMDYRGEEIDMLVPKRKDGCQ
jgi:hypothetical protein